MPDDGEPACLCVAIAKCCVITLTKQTSSDQRQISALSEFINADGSLRHRRLETAKGFATRQPILKTLVSNMPQHGKENQPITVLISFAFSS
jgi:hypothetical protein